VVTNVDPGIAVASVFPCCASAKHPEDKANPIDETTAIIKVRISTAPNIEVRLRTEVVRGRFPAVKLTGNVTGDE
jgi:hypothetical protein